LGLSDDQQWLREVGAAGPAKGTGQTPGSQGRRQVIRARMIGSSSDSRRAVADSTSSPGSTPKKWTSLTPPSPASRKIHIGSPQLPSYGLDILRQIATACHAWDDEAFRARYAEPLLDLQHLKDIYGEFALAFVEDRPIGSDVSLLKILSTELVQRIAECIRDISGAAGAAPGRTNTGETGDVDLLDVFYKALPSSIYGGSNDIQRNIIAKRVLSLPS
jgi:hypothetical protein